MDKSRLTAKEIQEAINVKLEAAGLGPTYRVGVPAKLTPPTPDGHNWHFIDVLTGDAEKMAIVTEVLSEARQRYVMKVES